jgi:hypothetical protein
MGRIAIPAELMARIDAECKRRAEEEPPRVKSADEIEDDIRTLAFDAEQQYLAAKFPVQETYQHEEPRKIGGAHGIQHSSWEVEDTGDLREPHPYPGATSLRYDRKANLSLVPIPGARWLDLWLAADQAIGAANDDWDHRLIECFTRDDNAPTVLVLHTGS